MDGLRSVEKILCLSTDEPTGRALRSVEQWLLRVHRVGDEITNSPAPWCGDGQMEDAGAGGGGLWQDVKGGGAEEMTKWKWWLPGC